MGRGRDEREWFERSSWQRMLGLGATRMTPFTAARSIARFVTTVAVVRSW